VSAHSPSTLQQLDTPVCVQPAGDGQESVVHALPSSQLVGPPGTQVPPLHTSPVVQALLSSQASELLMWTQPEPESQLSFVQILPSSQPGGGPPTQPPPLQVSAVVQASPSSHELLLFTCVHPLPGLQPSSVHTLLSLQLGGAPPTQVPLLQVSPVVQASLSSHGAVLLVWTHPVLELQLSSVQTSPSLQLGGGPPTQVLPLQASLVVQALPSSHELLLGTNVQPLAGLQLSSVQPLLSLQTTGSLTQA
jgi:hypothetical protein